MSEVAVRTTPRAGWAQPPTLIVASTGIALGLALGLLSYAHPRFAWLAMIFLVLAAGAVFVRTLEWRAGLLVLVIVTCFVDRYTYAVGRLNIRPEQVAAVLLLAAFVLTRIRAGRFELFLPRGGEWFLVAWFAIAVASSYLDAHSRSDSFKVLAVIALSSLALFLPGRVLADDSKTLEDVVRWLLLAFAIDSAFAVGTYFLHLIGPTIAISVNPAGGHLNAYGTLWEPNVLGIVSGAGAIGWALMGKDRFQHHWIGIALCFSACVVSLTRSALLATAVILVLTFVVPAGRRPNMRSVAYALAVAVVTVAAVIAADSAGKYTVAAQGAVGSLGNGTDITGRLEQFRPVFTDLQSSPIIGLGVNSFGQRHLAGGMAEHLANMELVLLNDTGILGVLLFLGFISFLLIAAWLRRHDATVLGLTGIVAVIFIANQSTETLELMITWLMVGMLAAAIRTARPVRPPAIARTARGSG